MSGSMANSVTDLPVVTNPAKKITESNIELQAGFDEYPLPDPTRTFILPPEPDPNYF